MPDEATFRGMAGEFGFPEDEYLAVNEFQAYLLQQELDEVHGYFIDYAIPRFQAVSPEYAGLADTLLSEYPDTFERAARSIAEAGYEINGIRAERLFSLVRTTP